MAKNKHLTDAERLVIEQWLKAGVSIKQIALKLEKSASTISREIRARSVLSDKSAPHRIRNRCALWEECSRHYLCEDKPDCTRRCASCNLCNGVCDEFVERCCSKLLDSPYVCNGCLDEFCCVLRKRYYLHAKAHEAYREKLIESRVGVNISEDELLDLDTFISPLIQRGQSVHHIVANNPDQFSVSEKSLYRYVDGNLFTARNIDMPRVCRLKPRKAKPVQHKVDSSCRIGRSFADYSAFVSVSDLVAVEMDSVIGRPGGKVLLTFFFPSCDFWLAFLRERNTSQSVLDIFAEIYDMLSPDTFKALFPLILTDNGSEFSNPKALEFDAQGNRRTRIFYCDPYASFQKPRVELSHEFLRRILPKGTSFDTLTQLDINLMLSHINSYSREKWQDKAPIDLFALLYGEETLRRLGIARIHPNDILLKPALLKK